MSRKEIDGGFSRIGGRFGEGENEGENERIGWRREKEVMVRSIDDAARWFREGDSRPVWGR